MRREDATDPAEDALVDTTTALPLRSKRTERQQKKRDLKAATTKQHATICDLPSEILLSILSLLRPSDIIILSRVNRELRSFIQTTEATLARSVISSRYSVLGRCFPLPILLRDVDEEAQPALFSEVRQAMHLHIHKHPYQHIKPPDPHLICTCMTCMLAWNNLCLVIDFAHWQRNLDLGEPIPMIPRGKYPAWHQELIVSNASIVETALESPLWYARILETHLASTIGSIRRHGNNKGNKRRRFRMGDEDAREGADGFLMRSGPPSLEFPFNRDNYYLLEAYLPNRGWNSEMGEWRYMPASQHERDVEYLKILARRRKREDALVETEAEGKQNELTKVVDENSLRSFGLSLGPSRV